MACSTVGMFPRGTVQCLPSSAGLASDTAEDTAATEFLCRLGAELMPHPLLCLSSCIRLKLTNISIGRDDVQRLAHALPRLQAFRYLQIAGDTDHVAFKKEVNVLWQHLKSLKHLTALHLRDKSLSFRVPRCWRQALQC